MSNQLLLLVVAVSSTVLLVEAFSPSVGLQRCLQLDSAFDAVRSHRSALWAAGGKKKRRRKQPPVAPTSTDQRAPASAPSFEDADDEEEEEEDEEIDISQIVDVANFKFDGEISSSGRSL